MTHGSQLFTFYTHMFASIPSLIYPHPPSSQSHDQPNPEAISTDLSLTPYIYCNLPSIPPNPNPHPTRLSPDARTIPQCAFGPRCGRAALSVSRPPNNALTEEAETGGNEGRVESLTDSARRILPLAPPHPIALTCGPQ